MNNSDREIILLIGPTGSGKSPLGDYLEKHCEYCHFDFGTVLREVVQNNASFFEIETVEFIRDMLKTNQLLPEDKLPIAIDLITHFLKKHEHKNIVMNGFPRTIYQSKKLREIMQITKVVELICKTDVVIERVKARACGLGEDHSDRDDDKISDVQNKLDIYYSSIKPLVNWFEQEGVPVIKINVEKDDKSEDLLNKIKPL